MIEHLSMPISSLVWAFLGFVVGYSGVAMFDDFDSQFSGLLILITIPSGVLSLVILNLINASWEFMLFIAIAVWISGAVGVSYKKMNFLVWAPPIISLIYIGQHFWHGLLSPATLIEFGLTLVVAGIVYVCRHRLEECFLDWHWGVM